MAPATDAKFPLGATLASGAYVVSERLWGERARGMYRGISRWSTGKPGVLVTLTTRQTRPYAALREELGFAVEGVPALQHIGEVEAPAPFSGSFSGMVEEEPDGQPLASIALPLQARTVAGLVRDIAGVLERATAADLYLGPLHSELIYARADADGLLELTALLPRARWFAATAAPPSYALGPMFPHTYEGPEVGPGDEGHAAEVFNLAALAVHWLTGEHPFEGSWSGPQRSAIQDGRRRPFTGPPSWRSILDLALSRDPSARPALQVLIRTVDALVRPI